MAQDGHVGGRPKRLAQLFWLVDNHRDGLELELLHAGYSLRDIGGRLSWHDTWLLATNAKAGGPLARTLDPRLAWTNTDWWLQSIEYSLRWLVWAKTKDGSKNRRRPKPVTPPGKTKPRKKDTNIRLMERSELDEFLNRPRRALSSKTL